MHDQKEWISAVEAGALARRSPKMLDYYRRVKRVRTKKENGRRLFRHAKKRDFFQIDKCSNEGRTLRP